MSLKSMSKSTDIKVCAHTRLLLPSMLAMWLAMSTQNPRMVSRILPESADDWWLHER